jgi:hypothetical protein
MRHHAERSSPWIAGSLRWRATRVAMAAALTWTKILRLVWLLCMRKAWRSWSDSNRPYASRSSRYCCRRTPSSYLARQTKSEIK